MGSFDMTPEVFHSLLARWKGKISRLILLIFCPGTGISRSFNLVQGPGKTVFRDHRLGTGTLIAGLVPCSPTDQHHYGMNACV